MAAREDLGSDTASHVQDYAYVKLEDGLYGGWKLDILCEEVSQSEKRLVTCGLCKGLLRDAYEVKLMDKQVIRCKSCLLKKLPERKAENIGEFIDEKMVFCPLDDCKWSDQLKNLIWHLGECPFVKIPCPLKCLSERGEVAETRRIERRLIGQHQGRDCSMRLVNCEFCDERIKACEVNMHLEKCRCFPIPCPNACTSRERKLERKELPAHLGTICPLQHIPCHYSLYGCKVTVLRKDLEQHEKDECYLHNRMMKQHLEDRPVSVTRIQENTVQGNAELESTLNEMSKIQEDTISPVIGKTPPPDEITLRPRIQSPTLPPTDLTPVLLTSKETVFSREDTSSPRKINITFRKQSAIPNETIQKHGAATTSTHTTPSVTRPIIDLVRHPRALPSSRKLRPPLQNVCQRPFTISPTYSTPKNIVRPFEINSQELESIELEEKPAHSSGEYRKLPRLNK